MAASTTEILIKFYLTRMNNAEDPQSYLDETVTAKYREAVKERYNQEHPEAPVE